MTKSCFCHFNAFSSLRGPPSLLGVSVVNSFSTAISAFFHPGGLKLKKRQIFKDKQAKQNKKIAMRSLDRCFLHPAQNTLTLLIKIRFFYKTAEAAANFEAQIDELLLVAQVQVNI